MSAEQQNPYEILKLKASLIAEKYKTIEKKYAETLEDIKRLEEVIEEKNNELAELNRKLHFLAIVPTSNPTREDVLRYKTFLSGLVREIDQCINDLTN